jgi:hydrogenase 3 maturation protease
VTPPKPPRPRRKAPTKRRPPLPASLKRRLDGAERLAVLAVGSELRGDDACGLLIGKKLRQFRWRKRPKVRVFFGGTAPENLTGPIRQFRPTHLLAIDAADFSGRAGAVAVLGLDDAITGFTFCTHRLPLTVVLRYLQQTLPCHVSVVAVQPGTLDFSAPPTPAMLRAVDRVAKIIHAVVTA